MKQKSLIVLLAMLSFGAQAMTDAPHGAPQSQESKDREHEKELAKKSPDAIKYKLERIYTCQLDASPKEVYGLIVKLGGQPIVASGAIDDAEYTLSNPLDIYGRPVRKISIHHNQNDDGDFIEYGALFTNESLETVASYANVYLDKNGQYIKHKGGNDLIFRAEQGATYVTCANDVRTFGKSVKRNANKAWNYLAGNKNQ